nr:hypothetical protein [Prosthecobacter vanneervenii]
MPCSAQIATDPYEGVRVTADATTGAQVLSWWGRAGRTYFVQQSYDLVHWSYVPVVHSGSNAVDGLNFACTDSRQFWRLRYTDTSTGGLSAGNADFDGDGSSNDEELALGLNPFAADSDGDGIGDGEELAHDSDPLDAASNDLTGVAEKGGVELPMTLHAYFKSITNQWYQPPSQSYVSWLDSVPNSGRDDYSGFSSKISQKLGKLYFPEGDLSSLVNKGWAYAFAYTFQTESAQVGYGSLYHLDVTLGTAIRGQEQPWCVSKNYLKFDATIKNDPHSCSYGNVILHQFNTKAHREVSDFLSLTPSMADEATVHEAFVYPAVTGDVVMDLQSSILGTSEVPGPNPGDPPKVEALPGVTDHWLMLPVGQPRSLNFNGSTSSPHRIVYSVSGNNISVDGLGVSTSSGLVYTSDNPFNAVSIIAFNAGSDLEDEDGVITAGIAYGDTGDANMATNKPLMKIVVYDTVELKVTVHPIRLLSATGSVLAEPVDTPDAEDLQDYLDSIFAQANVVTNVTVLPTVGVDWDTGLGLGSDVMAGNGRLELLFGLDGNLNPVGSTEEAAMQLASPPDEAADVNVYFFAAPGTDMGNEKNGMVSLSYYPPQDPKQRGFSYLQNWRPVLGHAGKAKPVNNGVLFVWDYPRPAGSEQPPHMWAIAHEIMHYVAKVGHSTVPSDNNHMPNSDNESRLMTSLEGPKREQGPKTLIKFEWSRFNKKLGPNNR